MSWEIKRKIDAIKEGRRAALRERVEATLNRYGFQLRDDDEKGAREWTYMLEHLTPLELDDIFTYLTPAIADHLLTVKELLMYPLFKSLIEEKILPVAVQYHKSQDDWMLLWRLETLWMWSSDPVGYRAWMDALGNDEYDRMPQPQVEWYKALKDEWDHLVESTREGRIRLLHKEIASLEAEITPDADPDYIRDLHHDIDDIQRVLEEDKALG